MGSAVTGAPPPPAATARRSSPPPQPAAVARKAEAAQYPHGKLTGLDRTIEAVIRQHTSGAVIDVAWAAAHRLFQPANRA
jgi:hypothetical protein